MAHFPKDFLWGGAVAAHQLEGGWEKGGQGNSIADVMTAGGNGIPRRITDGVVEGENYPNHEGIDFYTHYREDIQLFSEISANIILQRHRLFLILDILILQSGK